MQVILREDIEKLGKIGDMVKVADGYARSTGQPGVMCIVPGPGLTNSLSGLGGALPAGTFRREHRG